MSEALIDVPVEMIISATVLRCGCGDPDAHSQLDPPQPCPTPREVEILGELGADGRWHPVSEEA